MPFTFIDDLTLSDEAFRATGADLCELFTSAWDAVLHLAIGNPEEIRNCEARSINISDSSLDLLLYNFLEKQLHFRDASNLFLKVVSVSVVQRGESWILKADVCGEAFDPGRHIAGTEVKAITMYGLEVKMRGSECMATVVVDV